MTIKNGKNMFFIMTQWSLLCQVYPCCDTFSTRLWFIIISVIFNISISCLGELFGCVGYKPWFNLTLIKLTRDENLHAIHYDEGLVGCLNVSWMIFINLNLILVIMVQLVMRNDILAKDVLLISSFFSNELDVSRLFTTYLGRHPSQQTLRHDN